MNELSERLKAETEQYRNNINYLNSVTENNKKHVKALERKIKLNESILRELRDMPDALTGAQDLSINEVFIDTENSGNSADIKETPTL